ncbi:MAG TPA: cyclase family protein [Solirubrobacteraceae bacterium]|jgi:kynurenine formamidase|nr:cyclase family protein [Solirubrobacteraceae bacterium]
MRIVDLSAPIVASPPGAPSYQRTEVEYLDHAAGAQEIETVFGVPRELLRDGEGWTRETLTLGTHNATHVDAPWHYNSTIDGTPAETIEQLPLEWFFAPGVVVDFRGKEDGDAITAAEMEQALAAAGHQLNERDIVLVRTGRDAFYEQLDYIARGPGVTAEATRWLYERGVRVMGIDAWGWDRPLHMQAADAQRERRTGIFWEAHQVGLRYSQIERLYGLHQLPPSGFTVACFPLRVARASAAPARVVAILKD